MQPQAAQPTYQELQAEVIRLSGIINNSGTNIQYPGSSCVTQRLVDWQMSTILKIVSESFGAPLHAMIGRTRREYVVVPRQLVCFIARRVAKITYSEIGKQLGGKDHGTVMHGEKVTADRMQVNKRFCALADIVIKECQRRFDVAKQNGA